jgi:hypothetical protein
MFREKTRETVLVAPVTHGKWTFSAPLIAAIMIGHRAVGVTNAVAILG